MQKEGRNRACPFFSAFFLSFSKRSFGNSAMQFRNPTAWKWGLPITFGALKKYVFSCLDLKEVVAQLPALGHTNESFENDRIASGADYRHRGSAGIFHSFPRLASSPVATA
jgi:hypothetical protein